MVCLLRCLRVLSREHSEVSVIRCFHWIKNKLNPMMETFLAQRFWRPPIAVISGHRPALIIWKYPSMGRHHVAAIDVNVLASRPHPRTREGGKSTGMLLFFLLVSQLEVLQESNVFWQEHSTGAETMAPGSQRSGFQFHVLYWLADLGHVLTSLSFGQRL